MKQTQGNDMKLRKSLALSLVLAPTLAFAQGQPVVSQEEVVTTQVETQTQVNVAGPVYAETVTALNMRSWPSNQGQIIQTIPSGTTVYVDRCNEDGWCQVIYDGLTGYSFGTYLTVKNDANEVVFLTPEYTAQTLPTFAYPYPSGYVPYEQTLSVGEPTMVYYKDPQNTTLDESLLTYVVQNPPQPIWLNGEVVVGAVIPNAVTTYTIPNTPYSYTNINDTLVVVNPVDRAIIHTLD